MPKRSRTAIGVCLAAACVAVCLVFYAAAVDGRSVRGGVAGSVAAPPAGPLAQWMLNSASITGTTVADATGHGNTATVSGGPLTFGPQGGNFNGSTQYVSNSTLVSTWPAMTVSVWVNGSDFSGGHRLVANSHTDIDLKGFQLAIGGGGTVGGFSVGNGSAYGDASITQTSQTVETGRWYHIVGVYDGATVKCYLQGAQVASTAFTGGTLSAGVGPGLSVGRNPPGNNDYFTGAMFDVRLWDRALSAAEVLALYQAQPATTLSVALTPNNVTVPNNTSNGTLLSTASVVTANGSTYTGTLSSSNTSMVGISGLNLVAGHTYGTGDTGDYTVTITAP
jgi:hypothetical protein